MSVYNPCTKKCQFLCEDSFIVTVCMHTDTIIIDHLVETFNHSLKKNRFLADSFYYTSHLNNSECVFPSYLL